jgi:helicase SWR1
LTKREQYIEQKVKNRKNVSLFDTDGDLSRHNIIQGKRRRVAQQIKPRKRVRIKNPKEKLLSLSKKPLEQLRNQFLTERTNDLTSLFQHHTDSLKELYHLELFQNMLTYNAQDNTTNDPRFQKVQWRVFLV